jgi:hypothetical protein
MSLALRIRHLSFLACALLFGAGLVHAQNAASTTPSAPAGWSSSRDGNLQMALGTPSGSAALPSAPAPAGASGAQNDHTNRYGLSSNSTVHRLAFEVGAGFNAPVDKADITWGAQFQGGIGYNFNRYLALMAEYQYIHDKLPGKIISQAGATGGYATIWSATLDPVVDLFPYASNDLYITGGGGFYRKVTNFTDPQPAYYCSYYYGYCGITTQNVVIGHFSSNQGGVNIGMGYQHRFGGMYGEGRSKFFAEARYLELFNPAVVGITPSGLGVTSVSAHTTLIPVTFGMRW